MMSSIRPNQKRFLAGFDSSYNNTPQEYAGWGAGLFLEPALKVTFADGNRDLVLHYYASSSKHDVNSIEVVMEVHQPRGDRHAAL